MRYIFFLGIVVFWVNSEVANKPQIHGVIISEQLQSPGKTFKWLDTDNDGGITFEEYLMRDSSYVEAVKKEFRKIDLNGDGKISTDEYDDHFDATLKEIMEKQMEYSKLTMKYINKNDDEKLNLEEFGDYIKSLFRDPASAPEVFKEFDYDKDGSLDIEEFRIVQFQFPFDKFPLNKHQIATITPQTETSKAEQPTTQIQETPNTEKSDTSTQEALKEVSTSQETTSTIAPTQESLKPTKSEEILSQLLILGEKSIEVAKNDTLV